MKKLSFIVWHKEKKKMYELAKIDLWGDPDQALCDLSSLEEELFDIYLSEVEVMPYTGLKDKNGEKIYEGYIIKGDTTYALEVAIEEGHTVIKWNDSTHSKNNLKENLTQEIIDEDGLKIISNIYENPDWRVKYEKN